MTDAPSIQSQTLYDELVAFEDADLSVAYTTTSDGDPRFVIHGLRHNAQDFFADLTDLLATYNPKDVILSDAARGFHLSLIFDRARIEGEPDPRRTLGRVSPREPTTGQTVNECSLCRQRVTESYPPLTLRFPADDPYETPPTETHYLCIFCSPGHFDDVARRVETFAVTDAGTVDRVQFSARSHDDSRWVGYDDIDNPYIADVVDVIEQRLV